MADSPPLSSRPGKSPSKRRAPRRKTSVSGSSSNDPGWRSWTTVSSLMAYPSFVENGDSNIARIRRPHLIPSPTFGYSSPVDPHPRQVRKGLRRVLAARPREGRGRVDPGGSRLQLQALAQAEPGGVRRLDEACRDRGRAPTPRSATKPANGLYREETSANSARRQNHRRQIHIQPMTQSPTDC